MGVPFFFGQLLQKYGDILKDVRLVTQLLLLDANCAIHPVCRAVLDDNPEVTDVDELEKLMCRSVCLAIRWLCRYAQAKTLFIAIDGAPPAAKMKQQRVRRFKSGSDLRRAAKIRQKWGLEVENPRWDSAAITPGTPFMDKLTRVIDRCVAKGWFGEGVDVEFSSADVPGEGEHKILQKVKELQGELSGPVVFYGLDADLIFLSLASGQKGIYLLREEAQVAKKQDKLKNEPASRRSENKMKDTKMIYVDMDRVRRHVVDMMRTSAGQRQASRNVDDMDLVRDWITICYLLGNDFLPHFPSLSIKNRGLETLMTAYRKVDLPLVRHDVENDMWSLDQGVLIAIIHLLAGEESHMLRKLRPQQRHGGGFRSFEEEWAAIEKLRIPINDDVRLGIGGEQEWKVRWYGKWFFFNPYQGGQDELDRVCQEYYRGLNWVANYYFGKCPSWTWYYPWDHAPFLSDFERVKYPDSIKFTMGCPVEPGLQLLLVLPRWASKLMPEKYRHLVQRTGSLGDLYPVECDEDLLYKGNLWQGIPLLPPFDLPRVSEVAKKIRED
jgi:5'-3' exonuclease